MSNILLIDNDRSFHDLFSVYAKQLRVNALHAFDGQEGEQLARSHKPILIVLDIIMPGQDGYVTCRHLRAQGYRGAISMTSTQHGITGTWKVSEYGANGYMIKPLEISILGLHVAYARSGMKYPTVLQWLQYHPLAARTR